MRGVCSEQVDPVITASGVGEVEYGHETVEVVRRFANRMLMSDHSLAESGIDKCKRGPFRPLIVGGVGARDDRYLHMLVGEWFGPCGRVGLA